MNIITAGTREIKIPNFGPVVPARARGGAAEESSLLTGLISYWKLEEASGARIDSHGSNDLTDVNTVTSAAGVQGDAAEFVAANSEGLTHVSNASLKVNGTSFTFAFWLYLASKPGAMGIIDKATGGGGADSEYYLWYRDVNDRFLWVVSGASTVTVTANSFGSPPIATWMHVFVEYDLDAGKLGIAINGGTKDTATLAGGARDDTRPFHVGDFFGLGTATLDGRMDEIGFWKRVLTDDERVALYNEGAGVTYPNF